MDHSQSFPAVEHLPKSLLNEVVLEQETTEKDEMKRIERRKQTIRTTWRAVRFGLDVKATEIFYDRLFDQYPMVRPLFKDDMGLQYNKLYQAISLAVDCLDDLETLVPVLKGLGRAHAGFGTVRAHYEAVTECFIWTLNTYILSQMPNNNAITWMVEVSEAWEWALTLIGGIMADAGDECAEARRQQILEQRKLLSKARETVTAVRNDT